MRISLFLITSFLSWAAYDTNLFRKRQDSIAIVTIEISLDELNEEHRQQQKVHRRNLDVIPDSYRNQRRPVTSRCNYFSTKPRNVRFSNQRKIRRMFNNM